MTQVNENKNKADGWKNILTNLGIKSSVGITPIDLFAANALQGMLAACTSEEIKTLSEMGEEGDYLMSKRAWGFAKAMIRVRSEVEAEFYSKIKEDSHECNS